QPDTPGERYERRPSPAAGGRGPSSRFLGRRRRLGPGFRRRRLPVTGLVPAQAAGRATGRPALPAVVGVPQPPGALGTMSEGGHDTPLRVPARKPCNRCAGGGRARARNAEVITVYEPSSVFPIRRQGP